MLQNVSIPVENYLFYNFVPKSWFEKKFDDQYADKSLHVERG